MLHSLRVELGSHRHNRSSAVRRRTMVCADCSRVLEWVYGGMHICDCRNSQVGDARRERDAAQKHTCNHWFKPDTTGSGSMDLAKQ